MAKIQIVEDLTLKEIDRLLECENMQQSRRKYLGMSQIGEECWRKLWYDFRKADHPKIDAESLKRFKDGFIQEDLMAERLRMIPTIQLQTTKLGSKEQIGFKDFGGHFSGHIDGAILGILESPEVWHIWEHKAVNDDKFETLRKLKVVDEKSALKQWDYTYWTQAQLYMHYSGLKKHYLTCTTPGGRNYTSVRTDFEHESIQAILDKAKSIITTDIAPKRLSNKREFYKCKWCGYADICHDYKFVDINCRTCAFSTPIIDEQNDQGIWRCTRTNTDMIDIKDQFKPCKKHLYHPEFFDMMKPIEADENKNWILYKNENGDQSFINCTDVGCNCKEELEQKHDIVISAVLTSNKIKDLTYLEDLFTTRKVKEIFNGTIIDYTSPKWEQLSNNKPDILSE